jgi:hypothetical protein
MVLFLALFALDAFHGQPPGQAVADFAMHLLPAAVVLAVVAVSWRHPWIGAAAFAAMAIGYAAMVPRRPDWILVISGPLALIALLFAVAAVKKHRMARRQPV